MTIRAENTEHEVDKSWKAIWKINIPERLKTFIWQIKHGRFLTNDYLNRMSICEPWFSYCPGIVEDTLHIFWGCESADIVWYSLVKETRYTNLFSASLNEWVDMNLLNEYGYEGYMRWEEVWDIARHTQWFWRNKEKHEADYVLPSNLNDHIMDKFNLYTASVCLHRKVMPNHQILKQVRWIPLEEEWVEINVDGVVNKSRKVGYGGLIRDHTRRWCGVF